MQVISILLCYATAGLFFGAFAASGPAFLTLSGLQTGAYGLLLLFMTAGAIPAMTVLGNRIHRAPSLALPGCLVAFAAASLLLGQASGVVGLAVGFLCVGAASGALDVALNTRISAIESETGKALFNRAHATFPLAVLVAGPVVGAARDGGVGLGWIYAVLAVLMALAATLEYRAGAAPVRPDPSGTESSAPVPLASLLLYLGAIAALGAFMEMSAQSWAVIFVESVFLASATLSGFAITAFMLGLSVGRLIAHALDRRISGLGVVRLGAAVAVPAFLIVALADTTAVALIGLFLAGAAVGPIEPTVFRLVAAGHTPERRGRALSRVTAIAYVGYLSGPVALGAIVQAAGWSAMWATVTLAALAVLALSVRTSRFGLPR